MQAPRIEERPPTAAHTTMVIENVRSMKVGEANSDDDHVEHAGKARDRRRDREEEGLVERHVEAEIARAVLVVADRLQDQAGPGLDQQPRAERARQHSEMATR